MTLDSAWTWASQLGGLSALAGAWVWQTPWLLLAWPLPWCWAWWQRVVKRRRAPSDPGDRLRLPAGLWPNAGTAAQQRVAGSRALGTSLGTIKWAWGGTACLRGLIWTCLLVAAAGPRWLPPPQAGEWTGRDWVLALDVSGSMGTTDFREAGQALTRLEAVRRQLGPFITRRVGDRVGLVVFGGQAHLHTPLTTDTAAVVDALTQLDVGLLGQDTALGDAMALSVKYLGQQPPGHRTLMVVTDGDQTSGQLSPERALWLARRAGVRVMVLLVSDDTPSAQAWAQAAEDERLTVARIHDGPALASWLTELDALSERQVRTLRASTALPLYPWCLLLAAMLWALGTGLRAWWPSRRAA